MRDGKIDVFLRLKNPKENEYILETTIQDTGVGIKQERLPHLFKPYGELLYRGLLKNVQDNGIGIGLSNSKIFADALNGEIKFIKHETGDTQLFLSIPVILNTSFNRSKINDSRRRKVKKRDQ